MRRVARKGSEVSKERTSHCILFHSRSIPVSECECEELCFVLFLARQVAFLLRCFLCMCLVGCCCICILMHFVYVHCSVLLCNALFFAALCCVVVEGVVHIVLGVGRVEHALGSGILQIFYTPTWGVG